MRDPSPTASRAWLRILKLAPPFKIQHLQFGTNRLLAGLVGSVAACGYPPQTPQQECLRVFATRELSADPEYAEEVSYDKPMLLLRIEIRPCPLPLVARHLLQ